MTNKHHCWRCGDSLTGLPLPLSRRAECPACHAELHVCQQCVSFNPRVSEKCDEPQGEHPREIERANFCDYFRPDPNAYRPRDTAKEQASKNQLDALFGGTAKTDK